MARSRLTVDLGAVVANLRALDALSAPEVETAAVLKADGYGLGAGRVGRALAAAGVRSFFVALAEEGAALRPALGPGPAIFVLSGLMPGDAALCRAHDLLPCLNSAGQVRAAAAELPGRKCALQLNSGMNRLGFAADELAAVADALRGLVPVLALSHLACADTPDDPYNRMQAHRFAEIRAGLGTIRASLAATAGIFLGRDFHHDMTRPGIGLFGGLPFAAARPVVTLTAPVIQVRTVAPGESVGYGAAWTAPRATRIALVAAGYADGLVRALAASDARAFARGVPCPIVGRVSMDLLTVDITDLPEAPDELELINAQQTIDDLARAAGTIGHEVLTSLGGRYDRVYKEPAQPPGPRMIVVNLLHFFFASIGRSTIGLLAATGTLTIFAAETVSHLARPPIYLKELGQQLLRIGYFSLPVVGLTTLFTGGALALQIYAGGARFNAETVVPSIVAIGIVRELGPVLGGLMVAARVSSSIAAELGTMRVTEQIDALTTLSAHPIKYLVVPRVVAATLVLPLLVAVGDVIGIMGGYLVGIGRLGFNSGTYIQTTLDFLEVADVTSGLVKAAVFGFLLALMGCYHGYNSGRGAQGVGQATTYAVVSASVLILASNYLLTEAFF